MKRQGFIFDLDGTLLDTIPVCYAAFHKVFQKYLGRKYSDKEIAALFGPTEEGIFKKLLPHCWLDALDDYLLEYEKAVRKNTLFPGIIEALQLLKSKRYHLAIVSGKGPQSMEISLEASGLIDYFEHVITGSEQGARKPDHLRQVLRLWNMVPEEVAYIGDTAYDVQAAKEVGLLSLGALWAPTAEVEKVQKSRPFKAFQDVAVLIQWIEEEF